GDGHGREDGPRRPRRSPVWFRWQLIELDRAHDRLLVFRPDFIRRFPMRVKDLALVLLALLEHVQLRLGLLLLGRRLLRIDDQLDLAALDRHRLDPLLVDDVGALDAGQAAGLYRDLEGAAAEVGVDGLLHEPEDVLQLLALAGQALPDGQRPVLDDGREEELARRAKQQRERLDLDAGVVEADAGEPAL